MAGKIGRFDREWPKGDFANSMDTPRFRRIDLPHYWVGAYHMAETRVERRLAAILAADVAGYSRLMGADEVGTLTALKRLRREIVNPAITEHNGRIKSRIRECAE